MPFRPFLTAALLLTGSTLLAQPAHYWIYFTDRAGALPGKVSEATLKHRAQLGLMLNQETDKAPAAEYIEAMRSIAVGPLRIQSRWLNACTAPLEPSQVAVVAGLPFVERVVPVGRRLSATGYPSLHKLKAGLSDKDTFGTALLQIGGRLLLDKGLTGKGLIIGLIDAGFGDADKVDELQHLFSRKAIVATRDFEQPAHRDFYRRTSLEIDDHGTEVLTLIAGQEGHYYSGAATGATFVLARTDNALKEYRTEEDLWLAAMEWEDSLGVQLINSSLGYGLGFDDPKQNHSPVEMDGKSSVATRAVQIATQEKGIVVTISAGNDGAEPAWQVINAPADAEGAISVGATFSQYWLKAGYSGTGPAWLPYVKPDVACWSLMGTSFSAPVMCGMVACLMEHRPGLRPNQYASALRRAGHLAEVPNSYLGYGVPSAERALALLADSVPPVTRQVRVVQVKGKDPVTIAEPGMAATVTIFHKTGPRQVLRQATQAVEGGKLMLARPSAATTQSTIAWPEGVVEVVW